MTVSAWGWLITTVRHKLELQKEHFTFFSHKSKVPFCARVVGTVVIVCC
jgi:hypothetical protein